MTISTTDIQALYIAYFNRPADTFGLKFWVDAATKAGSVASVADAFSQSAEYAETYAGTEPAARIIAIYNNLFGRDPEPEGLVFWGNALSSGAVNFGNIAYQIFQGAQNADLVAVQSKTTAAAAFTASLDTTAEIGGYAGKDANAVVSTWLKGITNATNLATATTPEALNAVAASAVAAHDGQNNVGKDFATTVAIDTIVGTSGNDTINVYASGTASNGDDAATLSANDSIDGGSGIDTLNLEVLAGKNIAQVGTIKNVEIINISNADLLGGGTIDASKYQGSTNVNLLSGSVAGTGATVTGLSGKNLGVGAGFDGATTIIGNFGTATAANVTVSGVADGITIDIAGGKVATLNLTGTTDSAGDTITLANAGAAITTLNLGLKNSAVVEVAALTGLSTIVSTGTGGVDVRDAGTSVKSVTTAGGNDKIAISTVTAAATTGVAAKNATVSSGAGNDTIIVTTTGTGLTTVDAGAGDDSITVTKVTGAALSISGGAGDDVVKLTLTSDPLATTDVIDGGAGNDTIALAGSTAARVADDFIVLTKVIKNFEALELTSTEGKVADAAAGTAGEIALDASKLTGYTKFTFDATDSFIKSVAAGQTVVQADAAISLTATAAGYIAKGASGATATTYAGTLNVTDTVDASTLTARADTVNLTVAASATEAAPANVGATLTGDVKTAVVTLTNSVDTDADDGSVLHTNVASVSITTATSAGAGSNALVGNTAVAKLANLASLTLSGNGSATVVNVDGTKLVTVDAGALGGTYAVTADGHTKGDATVGLDYTSTNTAAETIKLGTGVDVIKLNASSYAATDTVTGLNLVLQNATTLTAGSDHLTVAGATTASKVTTTQTDIDLALKDFAAAHSSETVVFAFGGNTYVYHDAGTAGSVDAADVLVKLTGTVNLDALIVSLG